MAPRRPLHAVLAYPKRSPVTFGYVCMLLATHAWVSYGLPADRASSLLRHISTNLTNLTDHPVQALIGSTLFFDGTLTDVASLEFPATFITLGLGVCCFLARAERRWGALRAFGVFLAGHIGATLLTAVVIILALRQGWYDDSVRNTLDFGISYGAQTVLAACTAGLPRWARLPWAAFVLAWPLGGVDWSEPLPDFTAIGHLLAAALGFALLLARPETRWGRSGRTATAAATEPVAGPRRS
ncbi:rhomboid-like protein [Kitasatospora sp. NPDC048540]|uniref:rhomboid-like protein n=1 Tax=unclassified Kitasatospora TaxID=2633591 RepID=UPI000689A2CE|nr:rhomboid-like protein [Kitasatospora sp. MBT63]